MDRKEVLLSEAEELKKSVFEELRKTREELKAERDKWHRESEALKQVREQLSSSSGAEVVCCYNICLSS